jgi:hypothetical protein
LIIEKVGRVAIIIGIGCWYFCFDERRISNDGTGTLRDYQRVFLCALCAKTQRKKFIMNVRGMSENFFQS